MICPTPPDLFHLLPSAWQSFHNNGELPCFSERQLQKRVLTQTLYGIIIINIIINLVDCTDDSYIFPFQFAQLKT